jgi:predicted NUDIX family phosphoesterase
MKNVDLYGSEEVFVVPIHNIMHIEDGFTKMNHDKDIWCKFDNIGKYVYRNDAEGINVLQQLIPYIIIRDENFNILVTERLTTTTEERLHNKYSLGVGGHINPEDGSMNVLFKSAVRELNEEVSLEVITTPLRFVGYARDINGPTNDHLGCVFVLDVLRQHVAIKETDKLKGIWMTQAEMEIKYPKFESWSKFIIDYMVDGVL